MSTWARVHPTSAVHWLRGPARGLVLSWALYWIGFNVMSGLGELGASGLGGLVGHLGLAAVILAVAVLAWCWDLPGGVALLALTGALSFFFRGMSVSTAVALLGAPALAGLLLLMVVVLGRSAR